MIEQDTQELRRSDVVAFAAERIIPALSELERFDSIALHPTCSSTRLGTNDALTVAAGAIAERVSIPDEWGYCAFAGDRGMLHPELTESATRRQAAVVASFEASARASCNRTCELGMTRATGQPYRHVLELLADRLT